MKTLLIILLAASLLLAVPCYAVNIAIGRNANSGVSALDIPGDVELRWELRLGYPFHFRGHDFLVETIQLTGEDSPSGGAFTYIIPGDAITDAKLGVGFSTLTRWADPRVQVGFGPSFSAFIPIPGGEAVDGTPRRFWRVGAELTFWPHMISGIESATELYWFGGLEVTF